MHHFDYVNDELYCESVPVSRIADEVGTPFYLYSHATLKRHFEAFDGAFKGEDAVPAGSFRELEKIVDELLRLGY